MSGVPRMPDLLTVSAGHRRAAQQITDCIRRGQCCAFLGPRLSGMTEVLQWVSTALEQDPFCACIYIDLHKVESATRREFFASLASSAAGQSAELLGHQVVTPSSVLHPRSGRPPRPDEAVRPAFGAGSEVTSGAQFRECLKDCALQLKRTLIVIVDHLHSIPTDLVQALLTSLRAAYMDQESGGPQVVPVVCGALSLAALTVGQTSPFANIAQAVFISSLSDAESKDFIQVCTAAAPTPVSEGASACLLHAARGDPRLIDQLCRECMRAASAPRRQRGVEYRTSSQQVTVNTVRRVVRQFIREEAHEYEPFVEAVTMIEHDPALLGCILLLLERDVVPKRELPLPLSADLDPLALTGMVREAEPDAYQVQNDVYRQFLVGHFHPGYVGYLMALAGHWDAAIDCLETSLKQGNANVHSDLLAATVNAMYAAQDVPCAANYLLRGLEAAFGLREARVWHALPEQKSLRLVGQLGPSVGSALATQPQVSMLEDSLEARAYRGVQSLRGQELAGGVERAVPLLISGTEAVGVVTLLDGVNGSGRDRQWQRERQLVGYLSQAARAMEEVQDRQNQLLHIDKLEQERTAQELRLAHEIQVSFLPEQCPSLPGWEISADWYAAREVGGDFYDFIPLDEQHLGLVIADVSDKGMPAALFMSLCRTLVRASAVQTRSPATVLQRVNELILSQSRSNMLLTAFYGVLNWRSGVFTYANAGHPPPMLWCQACATAPPLPTLTAKGIMLGVMEGIALEERQVTLTPGDILILYTDGVTEPINSAGEEFGEERLARIIASRSDQPCSDIVRQIRGAVWDFAGQQTQFDDYTLVGIKRS